MAREELEYEVPDDVSAPDAARAPAPDAARAPAASDSPVPRWRRHADLLTAQYCLWRRKAIIQSARLFVRKQRLGESIADLAALTPEDLAQVVAVLGRGAGIKQALGLEGVPRNVKSALRSMLLSNRDVVGSDAHRTTLRHISTSYTRLFGPPLVFTTPNIADTRNLMVSLMYEGASVQQWRLLEAVSYTHLTLPTKA